jgi:NAD(P)-dependent dehydrogenase (short-subunit alcohol dehydrogenase family)
VGSDEDCRQLVTQTLETFGRCDVLVNNAGIIRTGSILDVSPDDFDAVLRVNLRSYFLLTQLVARHMVERGEGGAVVNMSSLNSVLAIPDQVAYVTSKGGLQQLTKASALGLAAHGIRVNAVGPGSIMTDILRVVMDDDSKRRTILSRTPLGRVGEPEEVARVVRFLASDDASYITGQTIFPDGGRSALNYVVPVNE